MIVSQFLSIVCDRENYKYDQNLSYRQIFSQKDFIRLCVGVESGENVEDIECYIVSDDNLVTQILTKQVHGQAFITFSLNSNTLDFGSYKVRLINTSTLKGYESEFDIVGDTCLENTLVLKYSNTRNMYDTVFVSSDEIKNDVNIFYSFRFVGSLLERANDYGISGEVFSNQDGISRTLSGFVKDQYKLIIGDNWGVPNAFGRHFRNALACNMCYLNDIPISITEAASVEREEIADTYPFFRFSQNISYNKNIAESSKLKNYRYLCNNNKVTPKLLTSNSGKILTTNRIF